MARADSPHCCQCLDSADTAEHTLFVFTYWDRFRDQLSQSSTNYVRCSWFSFELLPVDLTEKAVVLRDAEERFRLFYGMVGGILSAKEEEERATRDPRVEEQT